MINCISSIFMQVDPAFVLESNTDTPFIAVDVTMSSAQSEFIHLLLSIFVNKYLLT